MWLTFSECIDRGRASIAVRSQISVTVQNARSSKVRPMTFNRTYPMFSAKILSDVNGRISERSAYETTSHRVAILVKRKEPRQKERNSHEFFSTAYRAYYIPLQPTHLPQQAMKSPPTSDPFHERHAILLILLLLLLLLGSSSSRENRN